MARCEIPLAQTRARICERITRLAASLFSPSTKRLVLTAGEIKYRVTTTPRRHREVSFDKKDLSQQREREADAAASLEFSGGVRVSERDSLL